MFNKELWARVSKMQPLESYPALPCPYCISGNIEIDHQSFSARMLSSKARKAYADKFKDKEIATLAKQEENNLLKMIAICMQVANETYFQASHFISFFKCNICEGNVSGTGFAQIPNQQSYGKANIKIEKFNPPICLFPLHDTTPSSINEELLSSFNHFFSDTCSAGSRLRRAIEKLCYELGYAQGNLHRKIQCMEQQFPQEARWLESLKLVGNEAAHADRVTESDLLDSYKIFEVVLDLFRRRELEEDIDCTAIKLENKYKKI